MSKICNVYVRRLQLPVPLIVLTHPRRRCFAKVQWFDVNAILEL